MSIAETLSFDLILPEKADEDTVEASLLRLTHEFHEAIKVIVQEGDEDDGRFVLPVVIDNIPPNGMMASVEAAIASWAQERNGFMERDAMTTKEENDDEYAPWRGDIHTYNSDAWNGESDELTEADSEDDEEW